MIETRLDALLEAIRVHSPSEQLRLGERVVHDLAEGGSESPRASPASIVGLFVSEADLMDEVVEAAMQARNRSVSTRQT